MSNLYPIENPTSQKQAHTWAALIELATREVFEIMLGLELEAATDDTSAEAEFTGMVGLAGKLCGIMSFRCGRAAAAAIASAMLGTDTMDSQESVMDAIGEICNMVAGNFKAKVSGLADGCHLSVPTVIVGGDYELHSLADGDRVEVVQSFRGMPISTTLQLHT